eukprot:gene14408-19339_t
MAKLTNPHLSKVLGSNRPVAMADWRLDPRKKPPVLEFDSNMIDLYHNHTNLRNTLSERLNYKNYEAKTVKSEFGAIGVDSRRPFRILCLDGGGVRGILSLAILSRIQKRNPNFLSQIDFICGTSAGGILALLLSSGYSPSECEDIYSYAAPHIFGHNPWRVINPFRSKYSDKAKQELMQYYFGNRSMGDLEKICAVVAFRLDGRKSNTHSFFNKEGWRPAVFSNMPRAEGLIEPDLDLKVWDAAMRTSAAPTFFPVFRGYTDGGIVANNPSIIAASKAMAHYPTLSTRNIAVLSIGAGNYPRHTHVFSSNDQTIPRGPLHADWGIKQWIPFLLDLLLDGDSVTTEMVMHYLLGGKGLYHRIDP